MLEFRTQPPPWKRYTYGGELVLGKAASMCDAEPTGNGTTLNEWNRLAVEANVSPGQVLVKTLAPLPPMTQTMSSNSWNISKSSNPSPFKSTTWTYKLLPLFARFRTVEENTPAS